MDEHEYPGGTAFSESDRAITFGGEGIKTVPVSIVVVLTVTTLGVYQIFWLIRIFSELNSRGSTKTTPSKAVGLLFIPLFNLGWSCVIWKRFSDAIAIEYAKAGQAIPSRAAIWLGPVAFLASWCALLWPLTSLIALILMPIALGCSQSLMNKLARFNIDECGHRQNYRCNSRIRTENLLLKLHGWVVTSLGCVLLTVVICVLVFDDEVRSVLGVPDNMGVFYSCCALVIIACSVPIGLGGFLISHARKLNGK